MPNWAIYLFIGAELFCFIAGMAIGYFWRAIIIRLDMLILRVEGFKSVELPESAVIETTPNLIRERQHTATPADEEDSQIVTDKSPRQVKADKDRKLSEELDKLGR
jgi:hypothetical protein